MSDITKYLEEQIKKRRAEKENAKAREFLKENQPIEDVYFTPQREEYKPYAPESGTGKPKGIKNIIQRSDDFTVAPNVPRRKTTDNTNPTSQETATTEDAAENVLPSLNVRFPDIEKMWAKSQAVRSKQEIAGDLIFKNITPENRALIERQQTTTDAEFSESMDKILGEDEKPATVEDIMSKMEVKPDGTYVLDGRTVAHNEEYARMLAENYYNEREHWQRFLNDHDYRADYIYKTTGMNEEDYIAKKADGYSKRLDEIEKTINELDTDTYSSMYRGIDAPTTASRYIGPIRDIRAQINSFKKNGFWSGIYEGFTLADTLLFGLPGITDSLDTLSVLNKANKGEKLDKREELVLQLAQLAQDVESDRSLFRNDKTFSLNNVGNIVGMMPEFGVQMMLTGGLAPFGRKLAQESVKQAFKSSVKKGLALGLKKSGASVANRVLQTPFMGMTYQNYIDNRRAQYSFENRMLKFSPSNAFSDAWKAYAGQFSEIHSEDVGDWMSAGLAYAGRAIAHTKFINRITGGASSRIAEKLSRYELPPVLAKMRKDMRISGFAGENLGEAYGDLINSVLTMDFEDAKQLATSKYWWELITSTALMTGTFYSASVPDIYNYNKSYNRLRKSTDEALGKIQDADLRNSLKVAMANSDMNTASKALSKINWGTATTDDIVNAIRYTDGSIRLGMLRSENIEDLRLSEFVPYVRYIGENVYQSASGEEKLVAATTKDGEDVWIISGDYAVNDTLVVKDVDGKSKMISSQDVLSTQERDIADMLSIKYAEQFKTSIARERLENVVEAMQNAIEDDMPRDKVVELIRNNGFQIYKRGDNVRLSNGEDAVIDTNINGYEYLVRSKDGKMRLVPFYSILQPDADMAQAQMDLENEQQQAQTGQPQPEQPAESATQDNTPVSPTLTTYKVGDDVQTADGKAWTIERQIEENKYVLRDDEGNYATATSGEIFPYEYVEVKPVSASEEIPTDESGNVDYDKIKDPQIIARQLQTDMGSVEEALSALTQVISGMEAQIAKSATENVGNSLSDVVERKKEQNRLAEELDIYRKAHDILLSENNTRSALSGIADVVEDNPHDARARGYRRVNGNKVDRQVPIPALQGKEVNIKFSNDTIVKGNVAIIDAEQLQPSHIDGRRNPLHFIDEAQPKERNDKASQVSARIIAENIRPEEITTSITAYTGAPTINVRGEVIQGNNRSYALRMMWADHKEQAEKYKSYLKEHALEFGVIAADIDKIQNPVLVNMLDVDDAQAITLGQYEASDTESGGIERIKPKNVLQKMGTNIATFSNMLLRSTDEDTSFAGLIDLNGITVLKWLNRNGYITPTQYNSAFDSRGNITAEAKNDLRNIMYQNIFKGASSYLESMFNSMPVKAQRAILATAFRDFDSPASEQMLPEIQNSIRAYYALLQDKQFAEAKNWKEVRSAVEAWKIQFQIDDATGESYMPANNFSNFALHLAMMYKGETQNVIQSKFNKIYDLVQGTQEGDMFTQPDNTPRTLAQAIKETLDIDYDGQSDSHVLGGNNTASQRGQRGRAGDVAAGERISDGERTADSAGGTDTESTASSEAVHQSGPERKRPEQNPDGGRQGDGTRVADDATPKILGASDRGDLRVFEEGLDTSYNEYSEYSERTRRTAESERLVGIAKKNGLFIPAEAIQTLTGKRSKRTGESVVYINEKAGKVTKVKNPYAKSAMKIGVQPEDAVFEHIVHNLLFPETAYKLEGISEEMGDVRIVLSQDYIPTYGQPTKEQIAEALAARGLYPEDNYSFGNELVSVTDVEGDNVLLGEDGTVYFIDPIIRFKKPLREILTALGSSEKQTPSIGEQVQAAESEVNTNPTNAQKKAGNYKKGHVQIGTFDVTIEQPKGSVRSGVDASGKEWQTTMNNTYGYIRGTEGVDGDHIDVFLSDNIDGWNGRRVFVVDQYNADGTFDEHKVMLGFNEQEEAFDAYLSNYERDWEHGRRLDVSSVNIEDFEKWIESSRRKTKPFTEYKNVHKDTATEQSSLLMSDKGTADDYAIVEKAIGKTFTREVVTKDGKWRTDIMTLSVGRNGMVDAELNTSGYGGHHTMSVAEAANALRYGGWKKQQDEETSTSTDVPYTIEPAQYTTKKGKVLDMYLVKFDEEFTEKHLALTEPRQHLKDLRGWRDKKLGGYLLRSKEDALRFVDKIMSQKAHNDATMEALRQVLAEPIRPADNRGMVEPRPAQSVENQTKAAEKREDSVSLHEPNKPNDNEQVQLRPRADVAGRGERHESRPDEPLGASAESGTEQIDERRVDRRNLAHSGDDAVRGRGVSEPSNQQLGRRNARNNRSERGADHAPVSVDARIEANIKAIELAKQLLESGEPATPEQMAVLRKFSGWGGLGKVFNEQSAFTNGGRSYYNEPTPENKKLRNLLGEDAYKQTVMSANSAYYTPAAVIDTLWDIAEQLGFKGGTILEGSAGIGNILGQIPEHISERSDIHAVEIDSTAGGILSLLYPDAKVEVQGFEQTRIPNGSIDLAITNVPFVTGLRVNDTSGDSDLSKKFQNIHDFCIAKNVRKLREGGIGIFITSSGTLDNSQNLRNWVVNEGKSDFVGAFRMNNKTFVGTSVTSDIVVVRKRIDGAKSANAIDVSTISGERTAKYDTNSMRTVNGKPKFVVQDLSMDYNRYFVEHPERMGGEMFFGFERGETYRPTSKGLYPVAGKNQDAMLKEFVQSFHEEVVMQESAEPKYVQNETVSGKRVGEMYVQNGKLVIADNAVGARPVEVNANKVKGHTKVECFNAYSSIKSALADVLDYQKKFESDKGLKPLLLQLNKAYDDFVQTYGHFNKNTAIAFLRNDIDYPNVQALETFKYVNDKNGNREPSFGKSDIFSRRVVEKYREPAPTNVKDGISASIFKFGRVDVPYIAEQLGKSADAVKRDILAGGYGFDNPTTREIEVSYKYLCGNVREKLRQAQANNTNGVYDANVKALQEVIPMNIPAHLIEFTLGSSFIDPKIYDEYTKDRTDVDVKFSAIGGTWLADTPTWVNREKNKSFGVRSEMLGKIIYGNELITAAIQNRTITVSKTERLSSGKSVTQVDAEATQACAMRIDEIRQDFKDWMREKMQSDTELSEKIEREYNEQMNNYVPMTIPEEFAPVHYPGMVTEMGGKEFALRPHQTKAVQKGITQPTLLAHEVGTGKTFTLITTAMEMRRLGTARKPMIVVQNATVGQFVEEAKRLYPNAKVLTLEEADRTMEGRANFYAKIRYNDWDMIVVPQSTFEFIPDSMDRQITFIQSKIDEKERILEQMQSADNKNRAIGQAKKEIEQLQEQLSELSRVSEKKRDARSAKRRAIALQNAEVKAMEMLDRKTDDVENFDEMGIDALLIDEAHEYKHLGFATAMQRGVKGIDPSYSKKSQSVYLKTQAVLENNNGRNVVFATGTPISNTAAEVWTFMRYLMPADTMKEYGIYYFDDFVRNFGSIQQVLEFSTSGKFKENNRFAGYTNLPELARIWSSIADISLTEDQPAVKEKIPKLEQGKEQDIYLPQTRALRSIMKYVNEQLLQYEQMSGREKKENSHIPLTMYGIAQSAAVDPRLVLAEAEDEPQSKTNEAVRQTLRSLKDTENYNGTVAIFADHYQNRNSGFNLYEDIRSKLISQGVPAGQVVVIKPGMTVKKKLEIFDKVNSGDIRVILGSTYTLGTGVNIQERLHTLIHLDAPNRPMDYTQRNGRILRQGNLHKEWWIPVRVLRMGVEDSLDVTAYQRLKTKGAIANSIMHSNDMIADSMNNRSLEEDNDVFGDVVAQLSGSEYAQLKNQAEKELRKYENRQKQWEADQIYIYHQKPKLQGLISAAKERLAQARESLAAVRSAFPNGRFNGIVVGKQRFADVAAMADFIKEYNKSIIDERKKMKDVGGMGSQTRELSVSIGDYTFKVQTVLSKDFGKSGAQLFTEVHNSMTYSCPELGLENIPVQQSLLRNAIEDITGNVITGKDFMEIAESAERSIARNTSELNQLLSREGQSFAFADELAQAKERVVEYTEKMKAEMAEKERKYAEMDASVDAADGKELNAEEEDEEDLMYRSPDEIDVEREAIVRNAKANGAYMKAPNGKPTKLTARQWVEVRTSRFKEWFGDWEKAALDAKSQDSSSKVVDENGEPLVVYHGTAIPFSKRKFNTFDTTNSPSWFTPSKHYAEIYSKERKGKWLDRSIVYPVFLNIRNYKDVGWIDYGGSSAIKDFAEQTGLPFEDLINVNRERPKETPDETSSIEQFPYLVYMLYDLTNSPQFKDYLIRQGYDGIKAEEAEDTYAVFSPNQIKSATDNDGNYNVLDNDIRYRVPADKQSVSDRENLQQQMRDKLTDLANKFGVDVDVVTDTADLSGKKARAKGFFDKKSGKVTIVLPNNSSVADVEATYMHEVVGHYGLRKLLGAEKFDSMLNNVWDSLTPQRQAALKKRFRTQDARRAVEEMLATMAEGNFTPSLIDRVLGALRRFFRDVVGINLQMSEKDMIYMLYRSAHNLLQSVHYIENAHIIKDWTAVKDRLDNIYSDDTLFRELYYNEDTGKYEEVVNDKTPIMSRIKAIPSYAVEWAKRSAHTARRLFQERMLPVKDFQDELAKRGVNITSDIDYYTYGNTVLSRVEAKIAKAERALLQPLVKVVSDLCKQTGLSYDALNNYILAESAYERHLSGVAALDDNKDASWSKQKVFQLLRETHSLIQNSRAEYIREKGASGLTDAERKYISDDVLMKLEQSGFDALSSAEQIEVSESILKDLWSRINAMNRASLNEFVRSGLKSQEEVNRILSHKWQYYVPQMGEAGDNVDTFDDFSIDGHKHTGVKTHEAKGRNTKPENPLSRMWQFHQRIINAAEDNIAKQQLLQIAVQNRDKISDMVEAKFDYMAAVGWSNRGNKKLWRFAEEMPAQEDIERMHSLNKDIATTKRNIRLVTRQMEQLEDKYGKAAARTLSAYVKLRQTYDDLVQTLISYDEMQELRIARRDEIPNDRQTEQNIVEVYSNGVRNILVFADPQVARCIRGEFNSKIVEAADRFFNKSKFGNLTRGVAQVYTTYSPEFVLRNTMRDILHASIMHAMDKDCGQFAQFSKNIFLYPNRTFGTIRRGVYDKGKPLTKAECGALNILDREDRKALIAKYGRDRVLDTLYEYFVDNGGRTGFVHIQSLEKIEKQLMRDVYEARRKRGLMSKAYAWTLKPAFKMMRDLGAISEDVSRFATFLADIDADKSLIEATAHAKDITTNFNRRGELSGALGSLYIFFNASIQGTANIIKVTDRNKWRAMTFGISYMALGFLNRYFGYMWQGDDDDDLLREYIPSYVYENNLVIPFFSKGGNGHYFKFPQPQGLKVFFTWGAQLADVAVGKMSARDLAGNMIETLSSEIFPNYQEGRGVGRMLCPTIAQTLIYDPLTNRDAFGRPIHKEDKWGKGTPDSELGANNVNPLIYYMCKGLNAMAGGNSLRAAGVRDDGTVNRFLNWLDVNPSNAEYVITTFGGGPGKLGLQLFRMAEALYNPDAELEVRDIPFVNAIIGSTYAPKPNSEYYEGRSTIDRAVNIMESEISAGMLKPDDPMYIINKQRQEVFRGFNKEISKIAKERNKFEYGTPAFNELNTKMEMQMRICNKVLDSGAFGSDNVREQINAIINKYEMKYGD